MDANALNVLRQLKLPDNFNCELGNNVLDFLFCHSEERLLLIEWFLKQAETALGHQILLPHESTFSKLETLRLACIKLNLCNCSERDIFKFLQCLTGNQTVDFAIWEEFSILALNAQSSNAECVGIERDVESGFGAKKSNVFADNKRVLDQILRVESFHSLFSTEAQFEKTSSKQLNNHLSDRFHFSTITENTENFRRIYQNFFPSGKNTKVLYI